MTTLSRARWDNLEEIPWAQFAYGIFDSAASVPFVAIGAHGAPGLRAEDYWGGLLFGDLAELRWRRRRDGRFHVVYIHDQAEKLAGAEDEVALTEVERPPGRIALWGEREAGSEPPSWYESRIPGSLHYPSAASGLRMTVRIKHYSFKELMPMHSDEGVVWKKMPVFLFRCCALEGFDPAGATR